MGMVAEVRPDCPSEWAAMCRYRMLWHDRPVTTQTAACSEQLGRLLHAARLPEQLRSLKAPVAGYRNFGGQAISQGRDARIEGRRRWFRRARAPSTDTLEAART